MAEVKLVRLVTGEDVLTDKVQLLIKEDRRFYSLNKPTRMAFATGDDGNVGVRLIPLCPFTNDEQVDIAEDHVLYTVEVVDEIAQEYHRIHNNVVVPNQELVLPQ